MNICEAALDAVMLEGESLMVKAKQVQDRRVEVIQRVDIMDCLTPQFIRDAMTDS